MAFEEKEEGGWRLINNREATHAIEKSNGFWVGRRNLEVKIARYDMRNAVMNSDQRSSGIFRFASLVNHHKSHAAGFSTSSNHVDIDPSKEFDKRITINLQPSASEWLWRSAIAELKAISSPEIIQDAFSKLHFEGVKVRSLGGLFMIITFQSKVERNRALSNLVFKDWFKSFKHWNGEGASLSRLVWLKCRGMPLNVWCLKSFKRICEEWGEFITLDQETLLEEAFDIGRLLMVTDCKYKIDQWINITVNGRNYRVQVWEEECNDPFDVKGVKQGVNQSVQSNQGEDDVEVSQAKFQANLVEDSKSIPIIEKRSMNVEGQKTENNKVFEEDVDKANIIMEDNNMVEQLRKLSNEVVEETGASGKTLMSDAINEATNEQHFGVPMSAKLSTQVKSGRVNEEISNSTQGLDPFVEDLIDPLLTDGQERDGINGDSLLDSAQSEEAQDLPDARWGWFGGGLDLFVVGRWGVFCLGLPQGFLVLSRGVGVIWVVFCLGLPQVCCCVNLDSICWCLLLLLFSLLVLLIFGMDVLSLVLLLCLLLSSAAIVTLLCWLLWILDWALDWVLSLLQLLILFLVAIAVWLI
ncbi:hypothetical protein Vadar_017017 [Vaccinium darrowii]|uniref:Uncharacterized protein n=1 Tax=Vaccinium darrowii TaxID=229202 RepID=A0ACB7YNJ4_9ERIC|nr:hypothetical protein Vadar_017017 [Vaccinium darrowii]